jgi:hypothetical protein
VQMYLYFNAGIKEYEIVCFFCFSVPFLTFLSRRKSFCPWTEGRDRMSGTDDLGQNVPVPFFFTVKAFMVARFIKLIRLKNWK